MLVEEIPKSTNPNSSTVYFSSSVNLTARPSSSRHAQSNESNDGASNKKGRQKVNYNVNQLMHAQIQVADPQAGSGPLKSTQQLQLERIVSKRLVDLTREGSSALFELPKNFAYNSIHASLDKNSKSARLGNTPTTKRILSARRNLNLYFEEERNLISINSILGQNYQFITDSEWEQAKSKVRKPVARRLRPRLKLCCICGSNSSYSRCHTCGLFSCSVRCNNLHNELRCV
ncbi:uncharacterized protein CANTADRAFT_45980 [Suhomyces tanzawaensis NRRL Y-17324]|uniref:HIT-type domain-containing protein n=1 Tax=Suhomyces tanzawaensis NRRL Y-17324 TaxID=984487 RepID=A0A1E4SQB7_9ASCO|nr:uncharacterized protein CANTADRAFT_45980 [Suhomyces tanzawaensis NRRL Y-17324]ODV81688.1 hypothetical protein CANTADRAFT_45980 [Suhomyces tanzawaensis NRRL Y-17324]